MDNTLRHQIGQMIIAGFPSLEVDDQARRLAEEYHVGNFILFAHNMKHARQTAQLCAQLSDMTFAATGMAPFIAADQEGGLVSRIAEGASLFPGAMAMAAGATLEEAREVGKNCGQILRALGVNVNFAPVLDVNIEPMNPVIGVRSFGDQPQAVADMGCAMMEGMVEGGVIATVKHYPGHGNVKTDSHLALPVNDTDPALLEQTEFLPFQQAFDRGAPALMSCHIIFSQIDPDLPATLSPTILQGMLRKKQGFQGLVFTDCMEMDAIRAKWGTPRGAVLAVKAGCDVLCISHHEDAVRDAIEAIVAAVESGEIPRGRIQEAYDRIVACKKKMGLLEKQRISAQAAGEIIYQPDKVALHKRVSRNSVTLLRGNPEALKHAKAPVVISPVSFAATGVEDPEHNGLSFAARLAARLGCPFLEPAMTPPEEEITAAVELAKTADCVVLGLYNARFRDSQIALLRALEALDVPLVIVTVGGPCDLQRVRRADAVIALYEYTALSVDSVIAALETGVFHGKAPMRL